MTIEWLLLTEGVTLRPKVAEGLLLATRNTEGRSSVQLGCEAPSILTPVTKGGSGVKTLITSGFDASAALANRMTLCMSSAFDC